MYDEKAINASEIFAFDDYIKLFPIEDRLFITEFSKKTMVIILIILFIIKN